MYDFDEFKKESCKIKDKEVVHVFIKGINYLEKCVYNPWEWESWKTCIQEMMHKIVYGIAIIRPLELRTMERLKNETFTWTLVYFQVEFNLFIKKYIELYN